MRKLFIIFLATVSFLTLLSFFVSGSAEQSEKRFKDYDFDEYFEIISAMAETEEHPHFLPENAQRYIDYQASYPNLPFDIVIAYVNVNIDKTPYSDIQPVVDPNEITVLVNQFFSLPSNWEPDDFMDIGTGHLMREEAAAQFILMRDTMREANLTLNPVVTFRSFSRQQNHYNSAVARFGTASADGGFARPGHSEHQTGLAIDVLHKGHDGGLMMNMGFENSSQYKWMVDNAHEFGFILRYPNGYRQQSGFMYEPWHWRYVGVSIATKMKNEKIDLYEEFYGRYLVQGMIDKVNAFVMEQQALAEAAEAAAIAEALAAAEAAVAAAEAEALAAEQAAAEALALEEALAAEALAEAEKAAAAEALAMEEAEKEARRQIATSGNRHFLEGIAVIFISATVAISFFVRKKSKI